GLYLADDVAVVGGFEVPALDHGQVEVLVLDRVQQQVRSISGRPAGECVQADGPREDGRADADQHKRSWELSARAATDLRRPGGLRIVQPRDLAEGRGVGGFRVRRRWGSKAHRSRLREGRAEVALCHGRTSCGRSGTAPRRYKGRSGPAVAN